jgi:hypothetical protein
MPTGTLSGFLPVRPARQERGALGRACSSSTGSGSVRPIGPFSPSFAASGSVARLIAATAGLAHGQPPWASALLSGQGRPTTLAVSPLTQRHDAYERPRRADAMLGLSGFE